MFWGEIPPSIEDAAQERGQAGRRVGATKDTDFYITCVSLESYLTLLKRTYSSTIGMPTYRRSLLYELKIIIQYMVVPTHCINAAFADKQSNPFSRTHNGIRYLPPPCPDACSFCLGHYTNIFPEVLRSGITTVLIDFIVVMFFIWVIFFSMQSISSPTL